MTYDQLIQKLASGINFSFSRWGDGEFNCIMQNRPGKANCDGNYYYLDLGAALHEIIKSGPDYYMGMQPLAERLYPEKAAEFRGNGSTWINADILHNASMKEGLGRLWEAKKDRHVMFIGPGRLVRLCKVGDQIIDIGTANAWTTRDRIMLTVGRCLGSGSSKVVFVSAGMYANCIIDLLHREYWGEHTFIDAGSVFDPYCGVNSRKYHQQIINRISNGEHTLR